jgi:hypothetical protein
MLDLHTCVSFSRLSASWIQKTSLAIVANLTVSYDQDHLRKGPRLKFRWCHDLPPEPFILEVWKMPLGVESSALLQRLEPTTLLVYIKLF